MPNASLRPVLLLISGPPATGKTTLAQRLAPELGLFVLSKDDIKQRLGDRLPVQSLSESQALGDAAYHLLFHLTRKLVESGVSILVETPLYRGVHEPRIVPMLALARPVLIHCYAPQDIAARRVRDRYERGERHPVHFYGDQPSVVADISEEDWDRRARPLDLDVPTLVLDTTEGYVDDIEPILAFVRTNSQPRRLYGRAPRFPTQKPPDQGTHE